MVPLKPPSRNLQLLSRLPHSGPWSLLPHRGTPPASLYQADPTLLGPLLRVLTHPTMAPPSGGAWGSPSRLPGWLPVVHMHGGWEN